MLVPRMTAIVACPLCCKRVNVFNVDVDWIVVMGVDYVQLADKTRFMHSVIEGDQGVGFLCHKWCSIICA